MESQHLINPFVCLSVRKYSHVDAAAYQYYAYFHRNTCICIRPILGQTPSVCPSFSCRRRQRYFPNLVHFLSWLKYHPARYFTLRLLKIPKTLISTRHVDPRRHSSLATGSSSLVCAASAKGSQSLSNAVRSRRDGTRVLVARRRRYHQAIPTGAHAHACRFNILVMVAWEECTEAP